MLRGSEIIKVGTLLKLSVYFFFIPVFIVSCEERDVFTEVYKSVDTSSYRNLSYFYSTYYDNLFPLKDTVGLDNKDELIIRFNYDEEEEQNLFHGYEIIINDSLYSTEQEFSHGSKIYGKDLNEGINNVLINQYVKSGTGSLADLMELESAKYSKKFVISVGNFDFNNRISKIERVGDEVKLSWNKYPHPDFICYRIFRRYRGISNDSYIPSNHMYGGNIYIYDQNLTEINDDFFIGGVNEYSLEVHHGNTISTSIAKNYYSDYQLNFQYEYLGDRMSRLTWNRPFFIDNIEWMQVLQEQNNQTSVLGGNFSENADSFTFTYQPAPYHESTIFKLIFATRRDEKEKSVIKLFEETVSLK